MSTMRPGTVHALSLLKCSHIDTWNRELQRYDEAVKEVATQKKKKELITLDQWLWNEFPSDVKSRSPHHITLEELSKVMEWKLKRGKFRPALQGLVKQNSDSSVIQTSTASLALLQANKWKESLKKMSELRGVGPATASAILAPLCPDVPFMADEVLEAATSRPREYTLGAYGDMRDSLRSIHTHLEGDCTSLSLEDLGKALWSRAMLGTTDEECKNEECSSLTSQKSMKSEGKRKAPVERVEVVSAKTKRQRK
jgi:hypothetical protein